MSINDDPIVMPAAGDNTQQFDSNPDPIVMPAPTPPPAPDPNVRAAADARLQTVSDALFSHPPATPDEQATAGRLLAQNARQSIDNGGGRAPGYFETNSALENIRARMRQAGVEYRAADPKDIPGIDGLVKEQRAWFADPENQGKPIPDRFAMVQQMDDGTVLIHPHFANLLIQNYAQRHAINPAKPGKVEDLLSGNSRQIADAQAQQADAAQHEPFPYSLADASSPGKFQQAMDLNHALAQPPAAELGAAAGAASGFIRGSNQLGKDIAAGGADLLANGLSAIDGSYDGRQTAEDLHSFAAHSRDFFDRTLNNPDYAGSASLQRGGLQFNNWRWYTENLAEQTPAFAAMMAPGMGTGAMLRAAGATGRASAWIMRGVSMGSNSAFLATGAYNSVYDRMRQMGASEEDARSVASIEGASIGLVNGVLQTSAFGELILKDKEGMNALVRAARGFFAEGASMTLQDIVPTLARKYVEEGKITPLQAQDWERAIQAGFFGGLMGAGTKLAHGEGRHAGVDPSLNPDVNLLLNEHEAARQGEQVYNQVERGQRGLPPSEAPPETVQQPSEQTAPARPSYEGQVQSALDRITQRDPGAEGSQYLTHLRDRAGFVSSPEEASRLVREIDAAFPGKEARRPPRPEHADVPPPTQRSDPAELAGPHDVADWYAKRFGPENKDAIATMLQTSPGKYVLRDVPLSKVATNDLTGDETKPLKVSKMRGMDPSTRPPLILFGDGEQLDIADGGHRFAAATANGEQSIKAYVPAAWADANLASKPAAAAEAPPKPAAGEKPKPAPKFGTTKDGQMALPGAEDAVAAEERRDAGVRAIRKTLPGVKSDEAAAEIYHQAIDAVHEELAKGTSEFYDLEQAMFAKVLGRPDVLDDGGEWPSVLSRRLIKLAKETTPGGESATTGASTDQVQKGETRHGNTQEQRREPLDDGTQGKREALQGRPDVEKDDQEQQRRKEEGRLLKQPTPQTEPAAPAEAAAPPVKSPTWGESNKVITKDAYAELKKRWADKTRGTTPAGVDPELVSIAAQMAAYHIEAGARKFADFAKAAVADLGEQIKPYLKSAYLGAMGLPGMESMHAEMDSADAVLRMRASEVDAILRSGEPNGQANAADRAAAATSDQRATDGSSGDNAAAGDDGKPAVGRRGASASAGTDADEARQEHTAAPGERVLPSSDRVDEAVRSSRAARDAQPRSQRPARDSGGSDASGESGVRPPDARGGDDARRGEGSGEQRDRGSAERSGAATPAPGEAEGGEARKAVRSRARQDAGDLSRLNHVIEPDDKLVVGGDVSKTRANLRAINLLKSLESENRHATPEEKRLLAQYVGWGGLSQAFDVMKAGEWERAKARGFEPSSEIANWHKKWGAFYDELKSELTAAEFDAARQSTLNAHYTSREVIDGGIWGAVKQLGITGGKFLETSAGIGHILGLTPEELRGKVKWSAVELDSLTGRLLKKLYPEADVQVTGFEHARLKPNSYDLMAGNVPFHQDGPRDPNYPRFSLHNYFLARSIDLLKPGGFLVAITSNSTMDNAASAGFRRWMNDRADLVGAIRLPNNAFKANAGTEVTTDLLIYRKRDGQAFPFAQPAVTAIAQDAAEEGKSYPLNEYFVAHPEMMLGDMKLEGTMYRGDEPALIARPGMDLVAELAAAVKKLPGDLANFDPVQMTTNDATRSGGVASENQKEFSYQVKDGSLYQVVDGELSTPEWAKGRAAEQRIEQAKAWMPLREGMKELINLELSDGSGEQEIEAARARLKADWERYVEKHGHTNARQSRFLSDDPEFGLAAGLEYVEDVPVKKVGPNGESVTTYIRQYEPAEILTRRVNFPRSAPTMAESVPDAIAVSEAWRNRLDLPYIAQLLGKPEDQARREVLAGGHAFVDPSSGLVVASDEYLSGNVREKLRAAEKAAKDDPTMAANVEALQKVQPERVPITKIGARVGSSWIPGHVYEAWVNELLGTTRAVSVGYVRETGTFAVEWSRHAKGLATAERTYAGGGVNATEIINALLSLKPVTAYDTVAGEDGKPKQVKNPARTEAANAAAETLQEHFQTWVKRAPKFTEELEREYNEKFNSHVLRDWKPAQFDHYPNAAVLHTPDGKEIQLRLYQKKAVARGLRESYLLAHFVGAGKTFTFVTTAMEWRRLGLARKPMIVTQNATTEQIVEQFKRLYPWANVLAPGEKDFEPLNRKKLLARIAAGNFDAIVMAQSHFNMLPDDPGRVAGYIQEQIDHLETAIVEAEKVEGKRGKTVKELAAALKRLQGQLDAAAERKTDNLLNFEQLGVDALIVDEAHEYKKNYFFTQMENVRGLDKNYSERAFSLYMKSRFIQERAGGKNVILATGTPVTNTIAESWNMVRYVRPDLLEAFGVKNFDDFISTFATQQTRFEMSSAGVFRHITRLSKFVNGEELIKFFHSAADTVDPEVANLPRPGLKGGKPTVMALERSPRVSDYMDYLLARYERWMKLTGKEKRENSAEPLTIDRLAKMAALDMRLIDPSLPDDPGSKLNRVAEEIYRRWVDGKDGKTTQLVFADNFQSPGYEPDPTAPAILTKTGKLKMGRRKIAEERRFNLFRALKQKLIDKGMPADQVQIIYDHDTPKKRPLLFDQVNAGEVRVVMGHTQKLGIGVNIQERLVALHHLDAPYRPADVEQREGRILRQGNTNQEVEILRYGVKQTFDAGAFERLAIKQAFINQVLTGKIKAREFGDVGEEVVASYEDAAAAISGNPLVKEKVQLDNQVRRLGSLQTQHEQSVIDGRRQLDDERPMAERFERTAAAAEKYRAETLPKFEDADAAEITAGGNAFEGDSKWEDLNSFIKTTLDRAVEDVRNRPQINAGLMFARRPGPNFTINGVELTSHVVVHLGQAGMPIGTPELQYETAVGNANMRIAGDVTTGKGMFQSLKGRIDALEQRAKEQRALGEASKRKVAELEKFVETPFDKVQELREARLRHQEVITLLEAESAKKKAELTGTPAEGNVKPGETFEDDLPPEDDESFGSPAIRGLGNSPDALGIKSAATPNPRIAAEPLPGGTAKKLGRIILDFTKVLARSAVRTASPGRSFVGMYYPTSGGAVIRFQGDLDTAAHELIHFLDDKFNLVGAWAAKWKRSPFDKELIPHFSNYGSATDTGRRSRLWYKRAEGVAEWGRAFIVNPDAAKAAAPKFFAHFEKTIPPEFRAAIEGFSKEVRQFAGMGSAEQMKANMNVEPGQRARVQVPGFIKGAIDLFTNGAARLKEEGLDQREPFMRATAELLKVRTDIKDLAARHNPALLVRLLEGVPGRVRDAIEHGPVKAFTADQRADGVDGGVDWMVKPLVGKDLAQTQANVADGLVYLVARRTVYKAQQFMREANEKVAALDPADPKLIQKTNSIMRLVATKITRTMTGAGAGLFSDTEQAANAIKELAADPAKLAKLQEFAKRYEATAKGNLTYLLDTGRITREKYDGILAGNQIYADMHRLIDELAPGLNAAMGKKIGGSNKKIIQRFKGGNWLIENPLVNLMTQTAATIMEADTNYTRDQFNNLMRTTRKMYGPDFKDLAAWGQQVKDAKNAISTFHQGKEEKWVYREDIRRAMKELNSVSDMGPLLRALSVVVRGIPQKAITTTLPFVMRQLVKDATSRAILSRSGSKVRNVFEKMPADQLSKYRRAGGDQAGYFYSPDSYRDMLNQKLHELSGEKNTILSTPKRLWDWWVGKAEVYGDQRNRLVEMRETEKKLVAGGMDPYDAMLSAAGEARDLIDFAVKGRAIKHVMPFILFINPAIQGPARMVRGVKENPAQFGKRFVKYVLLPRLAFALVRYAAGQDDEYEQLPAWRRDLFLNFKVGHDTWISIPQPYELGFMGGLADRLIAAGRGKAHAMEGWMGSALSNLSPMDEVGVGGAWRAMIENTANWQFFFKRHIVPDWEAGKDLKLRDTSHASRGAQLMQKVLGVDARYIENMTYAELGNWGTMLMNLSDLGRDDKNPTRFVQSLTGMSTNTPLYNARDVQWVMRESKRLGEENSKRIRDFSKMVRAAASATDAKERESLAHEAMERAKEIRRYYEEHGEELIAAKQKE